MFAGSEEGERTRERDWENAERWGVGRTYPLSVYDGDSSEGVIGVHLGLLVCFGRHGVVLGRGTKVFWLMVRGWVSFIPQLLQEGRKHRQNYNAKGIANAETMSVVLSV